MRRLESKDRSDERRRRLDDPACTHDGVQTLRIFLDGVRGDDLGDFLCRRRRLLLLGIVEVRRATENGFQLDDRREMRLLFRTIDVHAREGSFALDQIAFDRTVHEQRTRPHRTNTGLRQNQGGDRCGFDNR